jgi:hypothetical protein
VIDQTADANAANMRTRQASLLASHLSEVIPQSQLLLDKIANRHQRIQEPTIQKDNEENRVSEHVFFVPSKRAHGVSEGNKRMSKFSMRPQSSQIFLQYDTTADLTCPI